MRLYGVVRQEQAAYAPSGRPPEPQRLALVFVPVMSGPHVQPHCLEREQTGRNEHDGRSLHHSPHDWLETYASSR